MHLSGDLRYHLVKQRIFSEEQTRFFIACLLQGLEAMHKENLVHRDIKPNKLIFDEKGYLKLGDFSRAREKPVDAKDFLGTPGYIAPEILN